MENNANLNGISFSILSPTYNQANFVEVAIESVISQTYPHWELIIVDDASTDNTVEKIKPYLKDPRIKLFVHDKNKGGVQAIRKAAKNASNEILAVFELDDKLHKDALKTIAKAYQENPEYGLIYSTHWVCDSKLRCKQITKLNGPVDPKKTNLIERKTSHFYTFRKEAYKKTSGFSSLLKYSGDMDIIYKLEEVTIFKFINIPLYYYRVHKKGVSIKFLFELALENYISKKNAFYRRLNTDIPNLSLKDLYIEYYKVTFFKLVRFLTLFKEYFRIHKLFYNLFNILSNLPLKSRYNLKRIKKKYFYWF